MARDHDFGFVADLGQCRRGNSCEAPPSAREGYNAAKPRANANAKQRAEELVCSQCGLCWHDAPGDCKGRRRPATDPATTAQVAEAV